MAVAQPALRAVRLARARARTVGGAFPPLALSLVFLVGVLARLRVAEPRDAGNITWIVLLTLISSVDAALGLRAICRAGGLGAGWWLGPSLAYGASVAALSAFLLSV